jgi:transcriptional regulator with XRE-family HTH domain
MTVGKITPAQCKAGRAMIGMTRQQLADRSGVGFSTLSDFENGRHTPHPANMLAIMGALEQAGVIFTNGREPGVKMRLPE